MKKSNVTTDSSSESFKLFCNGGLIALMVPVAFCLFCVSGGVLLLDLCFSPTGFSQVTHGDWP